MCSMNRDLIHIVILAKHALVSAGIRRLLEDQQGIKVIGETSDFRAGLEIIADLKPDIILLELNPIKQTDLDYIPHITAANKLSRIILLTEDQDYHVLVRAVENGVLGLVSKTQKPETLIKAIMKVSTGE
ncbi:MAG: response regulator transcription factor, partial [Anaerolineae bacterium]|nr:response regulator transcription factor [Anaerolineae bacterium]